MKRHHHDLTVTPVHFLNVLLILFVGLHLTGCTCLPERDAVAPERTTLQDGTIRELLASRNPGMILMAEAQVTIDGPRGKYTRTVALAAGEPSSLRIESIPLFGLPDFFLASKDGVMRIFLPGQGKFYIAAAERASLSRFLDINLSVEDTIRLMTGSAPAFPEGTRYEGYCEGDICRIEAYSVMTRVAAVGVRTGGSEIETIEIFTGEGAPWYSAAFDEYEREGDLSCPRHISLRIEEPEKTSIEIRYRNFEFTPGGDAASLFELAVPPGVTVESPAY